MEAGQTPQGQYMCKYCGMGPFDWSRIGNHAKTCEKARAARAARKDARSTKAASEAPRTKQQGILGYTQPSEQILTAEKVEEIVDRAVSKESMLARIASLENQISQNRVSADEQLTRITGEMEQQFSQIRGEIKEQFSQIRGHVEKMVESKLSEAEETSSRLARETRAPKQEQGGTQTGPELPDIGFAKREAANPDYAVQVRKDLEVGRPHDLEARKERDEPKNQTLGEKAFSYPSEGQPERRHLEETLPKTVPGQESRDQTRLEARGIRLLPGRRPFRDAVGRLLDTEPKGVALRTYGLRPLGPLRRRVLRGTGGD